MRSQTPATLQDAATLPYGGVRYVRTYDSIDYERLAEIIAKQDDLPAKEPSVFSGDVMTFPVWIRSFEALVERTHHDPGDRLYYLGLYTSGLAHEAIKGNFIVMG